MSEFTPTIKAVRDAYAYAAYDPSEDDPDSDEYYREFDRWLRQHNLRIKAEAWDEGYKAGILDGYFGTRNEKSPYRTDEIGGADG